LDLSATTAALRDKKIDSKALSREGAKRSKNIKTWGNLEMSLDNIYLDVKLMLI